MLGHINSILGRRHVRQDKRKELEFFDNLGEESEYNVFTDEANQKIIDTIIELLKPSLSSPLIDLGCGSGIFTQMLAARGYECIGVDLSHNLLHRGKQQRPDLMFIQADVEALPFADNSVDTIVLSCLVHHLPDPSNCAKELQRVLKPNGRFVAFDPNRLNPFMYLYRDRTSPFYSSKGVTENERPVLPKQVRDIFQSAGLECKSTYIDGLSYRYVASSTAKGLLPIYNIIDRYCFRLPWLKTFRSFVFSSGQKMAEA